MKRKILKLFLSFPLFLSAATAAGKSAIMPWEYFGMDGYTKNVFENYLIKIKFQKTFLENSISLDEYCRRNNISITTTQSHKAKKKSLYKIGNSELDTYIQPVSCKLTKTKYLFATIFTDVKSQKINHINSQLFDIRDSNKIDVVDDVIEKLRSAPKDSPNSKVKISLSLKRGSRYEAKGSYNCLNVMIS